MDIFNQKFCAVLSKADKYQKLLEDADKCIILEQDINLQSASLSQKSELETARRILVRHYGFHEMSKDALQRSLSKLGAESKRVREEYERAFNELVDAIHSNFSDLSVEEVWPEFFIDSNNMPEPLKYYVELIGFGNEEMFVRRAFYRAELKNARVPMTPYELEVAYMDSKWMFEFLLPVRRRG